MKEEQLPTRMLDGTHDVGRTYRDEFIAKHGQKAWDKYQAEIEAESKKTVEEMTAKAKARGTL